MMSNIRRLLAAVAVAAAVAIGALAAPDVAAAHGRDPISQSGLKYLCEAFAGRYTERAPQYWCDFPSDDAKIACDAKVGRCDYRARSIEPFLGACKAADGQFATVVAGVFTCGFDADWYVVDCTGSGTDQNPGCEATWTPNQPPIK